MKPVSENLFQFKEYKFFALFEEEDQDIKQMAQQQEGVGNSVIEKIKQNFSRFEKDAKGYVMRYKEFWQENETMRANFEEGAKVYKMFDSNYVVGLMKLPDEALNNETIDQELDTEVNADEDTKKEDVGKEEEKDEEKDEKEKEPIKEALEPQEDEENDLNFQEPSQPTENPEQNPMGSMGSPMAAKQPEVEEHPIEDEEEVLDTPGEPKMCLVVYNMSGENRDEIFRNSNNSVMHAFEDFYENTFKGTMKAIIAKARAKSEEIKKEREVKAKEQELAQKKSKVDQFLKES